LGTKVKSKREKKKTGEKIHVFAHLTGRTSTRRVSGKTPEKKGKTKKNEPLRTESDPRERGNN